MTLKTATIAVCPHDAIWGTPLVDVESSNVGRIGYDAEKHRLYVQFRDRRRDSRDGAIYEYEAVPAEVYDELTSAESVGSAFHRLVKTAGYSYRRIECGS